MHRRHATLALAALACAAATVLAGCGGSGSSLVPSTSGGSGASDTSVDDKGIAPDTGSPSSAPPSSASPTSASPTAPRSTRASTPPPGLRDFREVTYSVPSGFEESSEYSPLTPLETDYTSHYVVPTNSTNTKEVIGLYVYTLPAARTVTAKTNQVALIKAYNTKSKAVVSSSGIRKAVSSIDGVPAYTETATEPGGFTYVAYWAFGTHHFLQFSCQLGSTSSVATLALACGTTLASLQLN